MKSGIHPDYHPVTVHCACGKPQTRSTIKGAMIRIEICSNCHPFFTGKQKLIDTAGRVERFQKKYANNAATAQEVMRIRTHYNSGPTTIGPFRFYPIVLSRYMRCRMTSQHGYPISPVRRIAFP